MASDWRRTREPLYLTESPLILVLAQVRISRDLKMGARIPDLQERLRTEGYPRFNEITTRSVQFGPKPEPTFEEATRWLFKTVDGSESIVVTQDFIVLETNSYKTFEDFTRKLERVLSIFKDVVEPGITERIGLRFVDLIRLEAGSEPLDFYLKPGLLGLDASDLPLQRRLHRVEVVGTTNPNRRLVLRILQNDEANHLPPDLMETALEYPEDVVQASELLTHLDIDHFDVSTMEFEVSSIINNFWDLHDATDQAFRSAVTVNALAAWGLEENQDEG